MKKETLEYLRGERNAVKDEFIISREKTDTAELLHISHPGIEEPLYQLWHTTKCKKVVSCKGEIGESVKPKHTGGKKPYVILVQEVGQGEYSDLSIEASALLWKLIRGGHVEWHTSRLIRKRDKAALTKAMMQKMLKVGAVKIKRALSELTAKKVLTYDRSARAYFIDRKLVKKGGTLRENQIREGVYPGEDSGTSGVVYPGEQPCDRGGKRVYPAV